MTPRVPTDCRVLQLIDSLAPGGSERMLVQISNAMAERGFVVHVCVSRTDRTLAGDLNPAIDLLVLGRSRTWEPRAVRKLVQYCLRHEISVIHAHGRSSVKFGALIKLLCPRKLRLVFHDHFGDVEVDRSVSTSLSWVARLGVDHYIAVDPRLQDWAVDRLGLQRRRTQTIGNFSTATIGSLNEPGLTNASPLPEVAQRYKALVVANFRPQKDHPTLFSALASSHDAKQRLHVFLLGGNVDPVYAAHCRALVREAHLENNVTFLGGASNVPDRLRQVDFGILSSRSESGPLALLEYAGHALPFVATRTGQIAEKFAKHQIGLFSAPGDVQALARNLDQMVTSTPEELKALGAKARDSARHLFDPSAPVAALERVYLDQPAL